MKVEPFLWWLQPLVLSQPGQFLAVTQSALLSSTPVHFSPTPTSPPTRSQFAQLYSTSGIRLYLKPLSLECSPPPVTLQGSPQGSLHACLLLPWPPVPLTFCKHGYRHSCFPGPFSSPAGRLLRTRLALLTTITPFSRKGHSKGINKWTKEPILMGHQDPFRSLTST